MYEYKVRGIKSIYDGDTVIFELDLGFGVYKLEKLRLAHINAPELRGLEHDAGIVSRDWLRKRIYSAFYAGEDIRIKTFKDKKGKYGRYIAEIFINNISVNSQMIDEGLAVAY